MNHATRDQIWSGLYAKSTDSSWPGRSKTWARPLAEMLNVSVTEVLTAHTLEPLLRAHCSPVADSRISPASIRLLPAIKNTEIAVPGRHLRLCQSCVHEDIDFWGYSYWRRSHQIPGVLWCMKHGCSLMEVQDRRAKDHFPELCADDSLSRCRSHIWSPAVQRYADICAGLLEIENRVPLRQARYRMRQQASAIGLRLAILGTRMNASDKVVEDFPQRWLFTVMLNMRKKVKGEYFPSIDNVYKSGARAASGCAYALVLSALYASADEALMNISRALTPEEIANDDSMLFPNLAGARGAWLKQRNAPRLPKAVTGAKGRASATRQPWPFAPSLCGTNNGM
jgi:hypothetical protein